MSSQKNHQKYVKINLNLIIISNTILSNIILPSNHPFSSLFFNLICSMFFIENHLLSQIDCITSRISANSFSDSSIRNSDTFSFSFFCNIINISSWSATCVVANIPLSLITSGVLSLISWLYLTIAWGAMK